jgi:hypothetical protein
VLYVFTLTNTGTVTLRDLRLRQNSDITNVTCKPGLNSSLPVGATMTCVGRHHMTSADFELSLNSTRARFFASNILPVPDNPYLSGPMPRRVLLQNAAFANPPITRLGDLDVVVFGCWNYDWSREVHAASTCMINSCRSGSNVTAEVSQCIQSALISVDCRKLFSEAQDHHEHCHIHIWGGGNVTHRPIYMGRVPVS